MKTFTIISSRDQKKYVIETEAATMAELTAAMDANNISYEGMTLYEGLTKSEYNPENGEAILPHDVPYKGTTTNDLVFMLTVPQKKIKSGMSYTEMKSYIKENNLAVAFKNNYGKSYTHGTTEELSEFVTKAAAPSENTTMPTAYSCDIKVALLELTSILEDYAVIDCGDAESIRKILGVKVEAPEAKSPYSDGDIDDMFAGM